MEYREIGSTGIKMSEIGFGAEWMGEVNDDGVCELMDYCLDAGINTLDCWMADPDIRRKLGIGLKGKRDKWIIQGHIGSTWQNGQYVRTREMDKVKTAFGDLLKLLQTDYIDFGMIHYIDFGMIHYVDKVDEYNEIMNGDFIEYVRDLKDKNIIHHIGLSTHNPDMAYLAAKEDEIELILFSINPAYDIMPATDNIEDYSDNDKYSSELNHIEPKRAELYQLCKDNNTAITAMKIFAGGRLFNDNDSPFGVGFTPLQCIDYALSRPGVKSAFIGVRSIEELDGCLEYYTADENEKDYSGILVNAPNHSFRGQCTYCGHCAPCSMDINIAMVNKLYDLGSIHDNLPESIREHYDNLDIYASDCIECGECEQRCPFNVDIIEGMHKAVGLFGY